MASNNYDPQERELVKTLDNKLIPFLSVLYFSVLLDRSSQLHTRLTNPRTRAGLERDLNMDDAAFEWSLISFGIGSIVAILPSTLLLRRLRPSIYFATCFVAWGIITIISCIIPSYQMFIFNRMVIGVIQSGITPSIILYMVYFYTREEFASRFSLVLSCATAASSVSGLFTHYLGRIDGIGSLHGWQWIFIIEGIFALGMGTVTYMYLPNYPETCYFLSQADRVLAVSRGRDGTEDDTGFLTTGITKKTREPVYKFYMEQLMDVVRDVRTWLIAIAYFLVMAALDCLVVLSPEVAATSFGINLHVLKNSTAQDLGAVIEDNEDGSLPAVLLSTAPYAIAGVLAWVVSNHSDSTGERAMHSSVPLLVSATGFGFMSILPPMYQGAGSARYFIGLLPAVCGLIVAVPCIVSYAMDRALQGDTLRASTAAITASFGHAFGLSIAGSPDMFRDTRAPTYPLECMLCAFAVMIAAAIVLVVRYLNKQEEDNMWGKAPGLRRLLNDADEAKAWDVELSNLDFLRTEPNDDDERPAFNTSYNELSTPAIDSSVPHGNISNAIRSTNYQPAQRSANNQYGAISTTEWETAQFNVHDDEDGHD